MHNYGNNIPRAGILPESFCTRNLELLYDMMIDNERAAETIYYQVQLLENINPVNYKVFSVTGSVGSLGHVIS